MPIPQTYKINPLDLESNIAIGVSLPFNGTSVFNSTYSTKDQLKYNILNFYLTTPGERVLNPTFGSNLKKYLFEFVNDNNLTAISDLISSELSLYFPEVELNDIQVYAEEGSVFIKIKYKIKYSNNQDELIVNFI